MTDSSERKREGISDCEDGHDNSHLLSQPRAAALSLGSTDSERDNGSVHLGGPEAGE